MSRPTLTGILVTLALLACAEPGGSGATIDGHAPSNDAQPPDGLQLTEIEDTPVATALDRLARAQCSRFTNCYPYTETGSTDGDYITFAQSLSEPACLALFQRENRQLIADLSAAELVLVPSRLEDCLAHVANDCSGSHHDWRWVPECWELFDGHVPLGGDCTWQSDRACAGDAYCDAGPCPFQESWTCTARPGEAEPCGDALECATEGAPLRCGERAADEWVCMPVATASDAPLHADCGEVSSAGLVTLTSCGAGLACYYWQCQPIVPSYRPCDWGTPCAPGSVCLQASSSSEERVCQPVSIADTIGAGCADDVDIALGFGEAADVHCNPLLGLTCEAGRCVVGDGTRGAPCNPYFRASNNCGEDLFCDEDAMACADKKVDGAYCGWRSECQSGYCDRESDTCAERPECGL